MDDDLEPITPPRRGRPKGRREVVPHGTLPHDGVTSGAERTVQTAQAPVHARTATVTQVATERAEREGRTVDEVLAEYRAQPPVAGAPPSAPEVLAYDPGSVSRETNGAAEIEAELARRRAPSKSLSEMTEVELEAELARRRGQPPPTAPVPGDIRGGDDRPAPVFTANPASEALRILQARAVPATQAAGRTAPAQRADGQPAGTMATPTPLPSKDPRQWGAGDKLHHDPFAPAIQPDPDSHDGYVEAEVKLPDGSKSTVRIPLSQVRAGVEAVRGPQGEEPNFRCCQDGTPGGGGYVYSPCSPFFAKRVPGFHIHCPTCGNRTVHEIA